MRLQGKTAYVTGGARGIGRGIVRAFAAEGADVMVADVLAHECEAVAEEVRAMGRRAAAMQVDVTRADEVGRMVATVEAEFGGLDIAVNNAGVVSVAPLAALEEAEWDRVMDINAKGAFLCCKAIPQGSLIAESATATFAQVHPRGDAADDDDEGGEDRADGDDDGNGFGRHMGNPLGSLTLDETRSGSIDRDQRRCRS